MSAYAKASSWVRLLHECALGFGIRTLADSEPLAPSSVPCRFNGSSSGHVWTMPTLAEALLPS